MGHNDTHKVHTHLTHTRTNTRMHSRTCLRAPPHTPTRDPLVHTQCIRETKLNPLLLPECSTQSEHKCIRHTGVVNTLTNPSPHPLHEVTGHMGKCSWMHTLPSSSNKSKHLKVGVPITIPRYLQPMLHFHSCILHSVVTANAPSILYSIVAVVCTRRHTKL